MGALAPILSTHNEIPPPPGNVVFGTGNGRHVFLGIPMLRIDGYCKVALVASPLVGLALVLCFAHGLSLPDGIPILGFWRIPNTKPTEYKHT